MIVELNLENTPANYRIEKKENGLIMARPVNVKNWNHAISPDGISTYRGNVVYLSNSDKEKLGLIR